MRWCSASEIDLQLIVRVRFLKSVVEEVIREWR
jgi:hypothetical protein